MGIVIYNTMTRRREPLEPRIPGQVGLYVCGMTVYDHCHIGHARVMVVFDIIVRHLRARGLQVTYVRNFTDVDDKILRRCAETGLTLTELTERYIAAFHQDMAALGVTPADMEPRATEHLAEMQAMIRRLMDNDLAYQSGEDVYYAVNRFARYGRLSGKSLADLDAGSRVAVDPNKRNPLDFVLWKGAKAGETVRWDSPWGEGRPGWHIECSAMSTKYLGESFDIHGGGLDLVFPHHENEIAQTEGATGHPWVRYWIHNGFVNVIDAAGEREKMSKSLGNFRTIRDLLAEYPGEVIRLFILNSHYRTPLDFSRELLDAARAGLDRLYSALQGAGRAGAVLQPPPGPPDPESLTGSPFRDQAERFFAAMDDDFNTPQALGALFDLARELNRALGEGPGRVAEGVRVLLGLAGIVGLLGAAPDQWFKQAAPGAETAGPAPAEIEALLAQRTAARKARDFARADHIRDQLARQGITLLDSKEGTAWRRGQ
ncbi:MAG: cysteine--tRNA ligase [Magnetococcales bacterium]|nr:cysteine--tRNA ligase [Magnetococcales bacterium]